MADPDGYSIAFGAFDEGDLIGSVTLELSSKVKTSHKAHVVGMFVAKTYRGAGIGKALMQAAVEYTRLRATVRVMTLTVTQGNEPALRLYEAVGFKQFGVEPLAIHIESDYKAKIHMYRDLNERLRD
jgi:ribosomal protein S18 acetylase RimI-like enzyme